MRLLVSGGGTGGHIYPTLTLVERLKQADPDTEVLYVGAIRGLENRIVPDAEIELKTMHIQSFKRSFSLENFKTIYPFLSSIHHAKKIINELKSDVVLDAGGYVSGAVLYVATKKHIPAVIREQNSVVGVTNKFSSRYVDQIVITSEATRSQFPADRITMAGNPRAQQVAAKRDSDSSWTSYDLKDGIPTLMIFGGSQEAPKINKTVVDAIPRFNKHPYQVVFATGQKWYDDIKKQPAGNNIRPAGNVKVVPYIKDMPAEMPRMAALVSRVGAIAIAEITAPEALTILIPSPYVTANHQVKSAQALVKNNADLMITKDKLDTRALLTQADRIIEDEGVHKKMAHAAEKTGWPDTADRLIKILYEAIDEREG